MPARTGMGFLLIAPSLAHDDLVAQLQPDTVLPVLLAGADTCLVQDMIVVIPQGCLIDTIDSALQIYLRAADLPAPIDACFRAVARARGGRTIGVLLPRDSLDGAVGLTHIRAAGGLAAVQDAAGTHQQAPLADILAITPVDFLLPLAELPPHLLAYAARFPSTLSTLGDEPLAPPLLDAAGQIVRSVLTHTGFDLGVYKLPFILQWAERRRQLLGLDTADEYAGRIAEEAKEASLLLRDITSRGRQFFREPTVLDALAQTVLPHLFEAKRGGDQVRVWVINSATGEEAYSIAILLLEHMERLADPPELRIFATDPNSDALRLARESTYPETIAADVSAGRLQRFFVRDGRWHRVSQAIRQRMVFAQHNPLRDPSFSKLDLVVCRNLLDTLRGAARTQLEAALHLSLQTGGYACVAMGEELGHAHFRPLAPGLPIYHRLAVSSSVQGAHFHQAPWVPPPPLSHRPQNLGTLFDRQAQMHVPPGLLIDHAHNIVYYSAGVTPYLHQHLGGASNDVEKRIHPELLGYLAMPLMAALQQGAVTETEVISFRREETLHHVRLLVEPVEQEGRPLMASVLFLRSAAPPNSADANAVAVQLQQDVQALRTQLQMTTEEFVAMTEEMRVANEELLSLNEELQVKAAELEQSQQELQAANARLQSINSENQHNIVELRRLWANLQNLIVASDIKTLFLEVDLRIRWFSPGVSRLFNILPGDLNRPISHITHNLAYADLVGDAVEVLQSATPRELEVSSQTGAFYLVRILPYRTDEDEIDGIVLTFVDITARKQAEIALRQLNMHLEQRIEERTLELLRSNRELDQFAYVASHDLKAPLRAIANLANWVIEDADPVLSDTSKSHLDKLHRRVVRMEKLLDDLLAYSRAGRHLHKPEWVNTADLLRGIQLFLLLPSGFALELQTPNLKLFTERVPLETVLRNLIANAVKHHDRPEAGVVRVATEENGEWVTFRVKDNGPGIAPQHHERIFQIFQSLKPRDQIEGSGMGLAIVKKTVESQGGQIAVESELGQGATFHFTWPKLHPDPPSA
jgi:two-component system CheB/CheR fusion protein